MDGIWPSSSRKICQIQHRETPEARKSRTQNIGHFSLCPSDKSDKFTTSLAWLRQAVWVNQASEVADLSFFTVNMDPGYRVKEVAVC